MLARRMMSNDENAPVTPGHKLLPPERWFATYMLMRQRTHRTPAILRLEQNYGPEGVALYAAAVLLGVVAGAVVCSGIVLLLLSGGDGPLVHIGYGLLLGAIVLECPVMIRCLQGIHAGRRFRGSRPFVKRP